MLLGGGGRKRKRALSTTRNAKRKIATPTARKTKRALPRKGRKQARTIKRDIFS